MKGATRIPSIIKKYRILSVIYTNNSKGTIEIYLANSNFNFLKEFEIYTREDVLKPKPDPEGLITIVSKFQSKKVTMENTAYIGDSYIDAIAAHRAGMKVAVYCSLLTYTHRNRGTAGFYEQINELKNKFDVDGLYIDGLTFDVRNSKIDNKIGNWEMIRRFRRLFGTEGVIVYHGTSLGSPVATVPNIDSYCDATLNGEGVAFRSVNDPYVQYQVKKYGISNTVAFWKQGPHPDFITKKNITEAIIRMNGRMRRHLDAGLPKPLQMQYIWPVRLGTEYRYYLDLLEENKRLYLKEIKR